MDVHNKKTRSYNMSRISASGTKPELIVRSVCHRLGLRFRLNRKIHGTKPDLAFIQKKVALFVHGCFWHSHSCKYGTVIPKTNSRFWQEKRKKTIERDKKNIKTLLEHSWKVVVIWECEIKNQDSIEEKILSIFRQSK